MTNVPSELIIKLMTDIKQDLVREIQSVKTDLNTKIVTIKTDADAIKIDVKKNTESRINKGGIYLGVAGVSGGVTTVISLILAFYNPFA